MREYYFISKKEPETLYIHVRLTAILVVITLFLPVVFAQHQKHFVIEPIASEKIPLNENLSQGRVFDIVEDERGFIWIGTMDGLNRYDGYHVKVFRREFNDTLSLDNNQINKMVCSDNGILWVLTKTGVNKFNTYTEISHQLKLPKKLSVINTLHDIEVDQENNLWIASSEGLLLKKSYAEEVEKVDLEPVNFEITRLLIDGKNNIWIAGNTNTIVKYNYHTDQVESFSLPDFPEGNDGFWITDIHEDKEGDIWCADNNPSYVHYDLPNVFVKKKGENKFNAFDEYSDLLKENEREAFLSGVRGFESREGELWLVTTAQSIAKIDFDSHTFTFYPEHRDFYYHREVDKKTLFFDSHENLWLGTNGQGAYILPHKKDFFKLINTDLVDEFYLKSIRAFYEDEDFFWVGGYNGLIKMNKSTQQFSPIITRDIVYCIEEFPNNKDALLLGTEGGGLMMLDINSEQLISLNNEWFNAEKTDSRFNWVFDILNDGDSLYLIGAKDAIAKYHIGSGEIERYGNNEKVSFYFGNILNIYRSFSGQVFAGSDISGLLTYNDTINDFQYYQHPINSSFDFKSIRVNHINQTPDSTYWISSDKGLIMMNDKEIRFITKKDGLLNDFVYAAISDNHGCLWLSTNGGICSYHIQDNHISTFSINDGLQGLEFNTAAHYKSQDGQIFFGGVNGFNYFNPSKKHQQNDEFPMVITGVYFNNDEFKSDYYGYSDMSFSVPPSIEYFKLEFASLNYLSAPQNRYKYRIDEIHKDWIHLGQEHEIGFHGMDPGVYHLEILASDHHGSWSAYPMKITFQVEAMIWETKWFKFVVILIGLGFLFLVINIRIRLLKNQKKRIENLVEERTKELSDVNVKLRKVNSTKEKFLTIISHDIKNPLSAAQSVSADLKENFYEYTDEERGALLGIMYRSLNHLNDLITNLSGWSRLQHQEIKPKIESCDLNYIIQENIELVGASLLKKDLKIESNIADKLNLYADCKMIDTILRNLISNAIKFSYPNSTIQITAMEESGYIKIAIKDSGVGMSTEILNGLFSSERSQSLPGTANEKGTGFGLLMIHEFVKLNYGKISVESKEGKGSVFTLSFPVHKQK